MHGYDIDDLKVLKVNEILKNNILNIKKLRKKELVGIS